MVNLISCGIYSNLRNMKWLIKKFIFIIEYKVNADKWHTIAFYTTVVVSFLILIYKIIF